MHFAMDFAGMTPARGGSDSSRWSDADDVHELERLQLALGALELGGAGAKLGIAGAALFLRWWLGAGFWLFAKLLGLELLGALVGPKLHMYVDFALQAEADGAQVLVYCWRGGQRSASVGWLLSRCGSAASVNTLAGGYRAFRSALAPASPPFPSASSTDSAGSRQAVGD